MRRGRWLILAVGAVIVVVAVVAIRHRHSNTTSASLPSPSATRTPTAGASGSPRQPLVAAAHWQHTPQGYRLRVQPSSYGRRHAAGESAAALREAIADAGRLPFQLAASQRSALTRQLRCHAEFAPTKPRWDLESWRPDVSYVQTVVALCNP